MEQFTSASSPIPIFEQPRTHMELPVNTESFMQGYERLESLGLDADRISKLVVGGGGACVGGTVAELMVMPEHADMAAEIVSTAQEAIQDGTDPNKAVFNGLKMVIKKDSETKQLVEAKLDLPSLKKNKVRTSPTQ